jgi:hypothetical protein
MPCSPRTDLRLVDVEVMFARSREFVDRAIQCPSYIDHSLVDMRAIIQHRSGSGIETWPRSLSLHDPFLLKFTVEGKLTTTKIEAMHQDKNL